MISQAYLKSIIVYDANKGILIWKKARSNRVKMGQEAGFLSNGYYSIQLDGKFYRRSRIAWFYVYGEWPQSIDHINHITTDDRISNLRAATLSENQGNRRLNKNNKCGYKGVHFFKRTKKWCAQITINKRGKNLGYFDTPELAHKAYMKAAKQIFKDFAHSGR